MHRLDLLATSLALVALAGCASHASRQSAVASNVVPASTDARKARWTGNIRPRDQQTGKAMFDFYASKLSGSVSVTPAEGELHQTTIYVLLSSDGSNGPAADNRNVSWGLVVGRCGTAVPPVLPVTTFRPVELSSNGRGEVTATIPFEFPTAGEYHVDVYAGRSAGIQLVIACANLKLKIS